MMLLLCSIGNAVRSEEFQEEVVDVVGIGTRFFQGLQ